MARIFIIGHSHLRSLNNNNLITRFFIGPGSNYNLLDNSIDNIYFKINILFEKNIFNDDDIIFLFFGEPACRYSLINNLYPHKIPISKYKETYKKNMESYTNKIIEDSILNYVKLYNYISSKHNNTYVLSATTSFFPIINKVKYFNRILKSKIPKYISIFSETLDNNNNIKDMFLNKNFKNETEYSFYKNYEYDPIHMSNNLSNIFMKNISDIIKKIIVFDGKKYNMNKNNKYNSYII